jgi:hypothetical protein
MRATKVCIATDVVATDIQQPIRCQTSNVASVRLAPINNDHDDLRGRGSFTPLSLVRDEPYGEQYHEA